MNTIWTAWALGLLLVFALVENAAVDARHPRRRLNVEEMINAKIRQLNDPHPTVRHDAALTLGAVKAHKAEPSLTEALGDPDPAVCKAARLALCRIAATAEKKLPGQQPAATISSCETRCERRR